MVKVIPLDASLSERWLVRRNPFSDEAIRDLQVSIAADHFMVVATLTRAGNSLSLIFRMQRTIQPAGVRLRADHGTRGELAELRQRLPGRPIELEPLTDKPIVVARGERPTFYKEAIERARTLAQWAGCPTIYGFDGENSGRA
jgi:hypothetical protein